MSESAMGKRELDEVIYNVRALYEGAQSPKILCIALDYHEKTSQVAFNGNTTGLRHLLGHALEYLMADAEQMTAACPCPRCHQNLELIRQAHAILWQTIIPADKN